MAERPGTLLLAVDVGTGSVRAAAIATNGTIVAQAQVPHEQHVPRPGWAEQSPEAWWQGVVRAIREVGAAPGVAARRVAAIGVCGQMHGPVAVDAGGRPLLERVQLWNDKRPAGLVAAFAAAADAAALSRRTANPPAASWTAFKLAWMRDHQPEAFARAAAFLVPKDFVNLRLCGRLATDLSEASGSWLLDWRTLDYDPGLLRALGIEPATLPPIRPSTAVIGEVTSAAAAATGLVAGTPVVAGAGDFLAALVGSGVTSPGVGSDITGTSNLISVVAPQPLIDPRVMNLHGAGEGWVPFTLIDAGGDCMRWARRVLDHEGADFDAITALAASAAPGAEGLIFLPYLGGERLGRADARAQFFGITARHGKAHFYRAVMEGVALASRRNLDVMAAAGARIERLVASGGGARGDLWVRIKASVYELPIQVPKSTESGLLGAAALAGTGAGLFTGIGQAVGRLVRLGPPIVPEPRLVERYARQGEVFAELRAVGERLYHRLESCSPDPAGNPGRADAAAARLVAARTT